MSVSEQIIRESVAAAEQGSDIFGVLEKIAYFLYLQKPTNSSENNWFSANECFIRWAKLRPLELNFVIEGKLFTNRISVEEDTKRVLKYSAYSYRNSPGNSFDHWMEAQDNLALFILEYYDGK